MEIAHKRNDIFRIILKIGYTIVFFWDVYKQKMNQYKFSLYVKKAGMEAKIKHSDLKYFNVISVPD